MHATCSQTQILPRLQDAAHVAAQNSPDSTLRAVHITAFNGQLELHCAALRQTLRHLRSTTPAQVATPGHAAADAQLLHELTQSYEKDSQITFELLHQSNRLTISCGESIANILLHTGSLPPEPETDAVSSALIDPQQLRRCINTVLPAATGKDDNPTLNSVRMQVDPDALTLASTDGFRMAVARDDSPQNPTVPITLIIPSETARDIARIAASSEEPILLQLDRPPNNAVFTITAQDGSIIRITTQLTVGHFPDPYSLIPDTHTTRAVLSPAQAAATARISDKFTDHGYPLLIYLHNQTQTNGELTPAITFAARNMLDDIAVHTLPLRSMTGPPGHIAMNPRFFMDAVQPLRSDDEAAIELGPADAPAVIKNADQDNLTTLSMIMPMHVDWLNLQPPAAVKPPQDTQDDQKPKPTRRRSQNSPAATGKKTKTA